MVRLPVRVMLTVASVLVLSSGVAVSPGQAAAAAPAGRDAGVHAPLIGGDALVAGARRCTIGFNALRGASRVVITSSLCAAGADGVGILPAPAGSTSTPFVGNGAGTPVYAVGGATTSLVGAQVCMSGPVGGLRCGVIQAVNQTVNFGGGQVITGLVRTTVCVHPGEAGAPFFRVINGKAVAVGILVGGNGTCPIGSSWYKPIQPILAANALTLITA